MDLDYSKLSSKELEAIANNDYSKLSTRTLEALAAKPPEKKATDYLKEFGQATASLADTILGAPAAIGQQIGYATGRAFGLSPEEATRSSMKVTEPFMNPVGNAFGVTQTPGYQNEGSRQLMQGVQENVVQPLAQATGLPEQDVGSMVGTGMMAAGPMMGRAGQAVGRAAYTAEPYIAQAPGAIIRAPGQFLKGAYEGVTNPTYREGQSAMIPLREQYTPVPAAERFMGQMPGVPPQSLEQLQSQARPTSELLTNPIDKFAKATAPVSPEGYPLVPLQGRGMEAWGERVGRGIRTNPGQALLEAGVTAMTGVPVKTISQGISELAARKLASKTGFSPEFPQAVQAAQGRAGIQANMPTQQALPYSPRVAGPVEPQTLYAGQTGQVGPTPQSVQQAELAQKYAPQPIAPTLTPKQVSQEVAASKIQPSPEQQAILDQIRARGQAPQTPVTPVAPEGLAGLKQEWSPQERFTLSQQLEKLNKQNKEAPSTVQKEQTPAQLEKEQRSMEAEANQQYNQKVISEHVHGKEAGSQITSESADSTVPLDPNGFTGNTKGMANVLMKKNIDSIPVISGMSPEQVIHALYKESTGKGKGTASFTKGKEVNPELATKQSETSLTKAQMRGQVIKDWVDGKRTVDSEALDVSKGAYGAANNRATNIAKSLIKAGIDEIPKMEGLTSSQVIDGMWQYINEKKPDMLKPKRGPKKKGPDNVSQMLTGDSTKVYPSKEAFDKESIFSTLKEEPHTGSYQQGDKIIHVEKIEYGNIPKDVTKDWEQTKMYATDKNGNRVPVGKDWTEADPEPLTSQLKRRFKKD